MRVEERECDREFIDDTEYDESVTDHYGFINVTRSYEDAMQDALENIDPDQEAENYCEESTNNAIDEFNNSQRRIDKFKASLVNPQDVDNPDSFLYAILYALRYKQSEKTEPCTDNSELRSDVTPEIFDEMNQLRID